MQPLAPISVRDRCAQNRASPHVVRQREQHGPYTFVARVDIDRSLRMPKKMSSLWHAAQ
jgi:hypothetical protein